VVFRALTSALEASSSTVDNQDLPDRLVGERIRELRKIQRQTLKEVAAAADISVSYLSQIERNVSRLPIGVLKRISDALGVHMNWFFLHGPLGPTEENDVIVRADNRRRLTFPGLGISEELLSPNLAGPLELLISTIDPGADSEFYAHEGTEAGVVISGVLQLSVESRQFQLARGDSFAFPSTRLHRCANYGTEPTRVLWVITPPHY